MPTKEAIQLARLKYRQSRGKMLYLEERVKAFERRTGRKVKRDYTVNKEFVDNLYKFTDCYYCFEVVSESDKSIDHKKSLERGGSHSRDNLCMCCFSCNSSKGSMTEAEFIESGRLETLIHRRLEVRHFEYA